MELNSLSPTAYTSIFHHHNTLLSYTYTAAYVRDVLVTRDVCVKYKKVNIHISRDTLSGIFVTVSVQSFLSHSTHLAVHNVIYHRECGINIDHYLFNLPSQHLSAAFLLCLSLRINSI